jgi:hypothetical protein
VAWQHLVQVEVEVLVAEKWVVCLVALVKWVVLKVVKWVVLKVECLHKVVKHKVVKHKVVLNRLQNSKN